MYILFEATCFYICIFLVFVFCLHSIGSCFTTRFCAAETELGFTASDIVTPSIGPVLDQNHMLILGIKLQQLGLMTWCMVQFQDLCWSFNFKWSNQFEKMIIPRIKFIQLSQNLHSIEVGKEIITWISKRKRTEVGDLHDVRHYSTSVFWTKARSHVQIWCKLCYQLNILVDLHVRIWKQHVRSRDGLFSES